MLEWVQELWKTYVAGKEDWVFSGIGTYVLSGTVATLIASLAWLFRRKRKQGSSNSINVSGSSGVNIATDNAKITNIGRKTSGDG